MGAVEIEVGRDARPAKEARRVDADERLPVELEPNVDAVARRAGHLAGNHPLGLHQRVDQRALARVAAADEGHLHDRFARGRLVRRLGQPFDDGLDQLLLAHILAVLTAITFRPSR